MHLIQNIVKATICLHNYLRLTENAGYLPTGFVDSYDESGAFKPGEWRAVVLADTGLQSLNRLGGNRSKFSAETVRETYMKYFNSEGGTLNWQVKHVRNCGRLSHSN